MKCKVSLLAITLLLSSFQSSTAMIARQTLYKREVQNVNIAADDVKHTPVSKWGHKTYTHEFKDEPPNVPIVHIRNQMLYITISIGTPPQMFKVGLNTGEIMSDFWVISADCTTSECMQHSQYDHNHSITYVPNGQHFDSGISSGYLSFDDIHLGQLILNTQDFGEAGKIVGLSRFGFDGMLSMGVQPISNTDSPLLFDLVQQKKIDEPIFGIYLASRNDSVPLLKGELILGGRDPNHYVGKLSYTKLTSRNCWQIMMDSVSIVKINNSTSKIACKNMMDVKLL